MQLVPAAHSGYTQNLAGPAPAEPNTSAFVSDIANAINSEKEDTAQYAAAAARLTASLAEDAGATRTRARIPTAADVKKAAARLTGPAADEGDDNTVSPFDTAEIPVPHSREYERAEDAPAVRAELAKRLTWATIGCIAAGVAAAVMIVLAVLPARPAALNDATVYPAVMLVLLLAACAANWQTFLSGFKGLAKMPTPDSLAILPALGAAIQCIVLLATGGYTGTLPMMTGPAALVLCLNAVGRRLNAVTVSENFQLVSAKVEHSVAYRLKDAGALKAVSQGLAEPHPSVLVSRPTQIFRSFLTNSAAHGTSDKNQQQFAWVLAACGAAVGVDLHIVVRAAHDLQQFLQRLGGDDDADIAGTLNIALDDGQTVAVQGNDGQAAWLNDEQLAGVGGFLVVLADGVDGFLDHLAQHTALDGHGVVGAGHRQAGV